MRWPWSKPSNRNGHAEAGVATVARIVDGSYVFTTRYQDGIFVGMNTVDLERVAQKLREAADYYEAEGKRQRNGV